MSYTKGSPSPKSPRGVSFFQQFPRQFIKPYGEADDAPSSETVFRRIQPFTCEWLVRPKVAASEFAETIVKNLDVLENDESGILREGLAEALKKHLSELRESVAPLRKDSDVEPTKQHVVNMLKFMFDENDILDDAMDAMFKVGGALYNTACQYIVFRSLIRNPETYASLTQCENGSDANFKAGKNIPSMRDFMLSSIVGSARVNVAKTKRRNLLSSFDEDTEPSRSPEEKNPPQAFSRRHEHRPFPVSPFNDDAEAAVNKDRPSSSSQFLAPQGDNADSEDTSDDGRNALLELCDEVEAMEKSKKTKPDDAKKRKKDRATEPGKKDKTKKKKLKK